MSLFYPLGVYGFGMLSVFQLTLLKACRLPPKILCRSHKEADKSDDDPMTGIMDSFVIQAGPASGHVCGPTMVT